MRTESTTVSSEREYETPSLAELAKAIGVGIISFLLGGASFFGAIFPFSAAFVASLPEKHLATACIGSVLSILLFAKSNQTGWLIFAVLAVAGARLCLKKIMRENSSRIKPAFMGIIAFAGMLFSTLIRSLMGNILPIDMVLLCIQTVLCGCFGYFFAIASEAIFRPKSNPILSNVQITSMAILFIAALCGAAGYNVFNLNPGVIFGVLSIYLAMNRFGIVGASVSSIVVAIALNLYSTDMLSFAAMLIISSFIAGAFSPVGKLGQIAAFIMVSTFCMVLLGAPIWLTYRLIDIFLATALYVLIPKRAMALLSLRPAAASASISAGTMQENMAAKLSYASDTIKDLRAELKTVSTKFGEIDYNNIGSVSDMAANSVCKGCSRSLDCWDKSYSDTVDAFHPITAQLRALGCVSEDTMPFYFLEKCCKLSRLIESINSFYEVFLAGQTAKRQLSESRKIVFEQFDSLANMLCEMSEEIGEISGYDDATARKAQMAFTKLEGEPLQVVCPVDRFGRTTVEIYTDNMVKTSPIVLCQAISNAADCIFDLPDITTVCQKTKLAFFEKAGFCAEYSIQQSCCGDNAVCGDSVEHFTDSKGYSYFLLSDGMGSGGRAAIDSVMTCSILSKLLKAGFGVASAIKLLNSSLLVKSTDESLSTIDLVRIDLYTGNAELFKAGAATSFFLQNGEVTRVSSAALPIGILQNAECESRVLPLRNGDYFLLVSDGATQNGEGYLSDTFKRLCSQNRPIKEIASTLCREAKERQEDQQDDITVIAVKVRKGV